MSEGFGFFCDSDLSSDLDAEASELDMELDDITPEDIQADYAEIQLEAEMDADSLSDRFHKQSGLSYRERRSLDANAEGFSDTADAMTDGEENNPLDFEESIDENNDTEVQDVGEIDEWIDEINPNYDPYDKNSPYSNNCGSCALAVAMHLDGIKDYEASANNINTVDMMNDVTGMEQVTMSPEEIESYLIGQGAGAHGIVGIDRAEGPGHWFNAYYDGNKVMAIDGQTGEVFDWPPDYGDVTNWDISVEKGE